MSRSNVGTGFALTLLAGLLAAMPATTWAGNWPGWRGPTGSGYSDEKDLPLKWDGKTGEGVLWKVPLKDTTGHSSPIVWEDRVFLTTAAKQSREEEARKDIPDHDIACYRAGDGKLLWKTRVAHGPHQEGYAIYAVPTPVTDGKAVYVWFGSAVVVAVDFDGKLLWRHERSGPFSLNPGLCTSLALYQDTLILLCDQSRGLAFLQGLDKKTGAVKWEQKRTNANCNNTTPLLIQVKGKPQMIIAGADKLEGLDPATGEPIWWCKTPGFGESPIAAGSLVYTAKGGNEPALLVDPSGKGDVAKTHVKWREAKVPGDYSSPVVCGDYICHVQKEGVIGCLRLSTGEAVSSERLDGASKLASPIATADGRVYFVSTGKSYVIKPGPTIEVIGGGNLNGWGNGSSPAVSGGRIFVRDFENLWCIAHHE
ncbi:MAG: PQQ-binding-like beta-propeller repeat protein [Thermoguttaceae bacterium]|jgi:outer membrane protein assembly factor BamB